MWLAHPKGCKCAECKETRRAAKFARDRAKHEDLIDVAVQEAKKWFLGRESKLVASIRELLEFEKKHPNVLRRRFAARGMFDKVIVHRARKE